METGLRTFLRWKPAANPMRQNRKTLASRFWENNSLSVVLLVIFAATLTGHFLTGHAVYNQEQAEHAEPVIGLLPYLASGHFLESLFENWESEFLQIAMYVILTVFLYQTGSAESKDRLKEETVDEDPEKHRNDEGAPWPVKRGGLALALYNYSLSIVLLAFFVISFVFHALAGFTHFNEQQLAHNQPPARMGEYLAGAQFWFESFQNWQSEFLSVAAIVILTVYLRQKGSPESKPVFYPHSHTGRE
jgi:hypothetical protein